VGALGENVEKNKKLTAKGKKKIFLVQLTDDELLTMYLWVHAEYDILRSGISKKEVRKYFRKKTNSKRKKENFSCTIN